MTLNNLVEAPKPDDPVPHDEGLCRVCLLTKISDARGNLTFIRGGKMLTGRPFDIPGAFPPHHLSDQDFDHVQSQATMDAP